MTTDIDAGAATSPRGLPGAVRGAGEVTDAGPAGPGASPVPAPADAGLRRRYEAYRRRQGAELLSLIPRAGIRPLYRAARERARETGAPDPEPEGDDALGMLADFCSDLLPLPPYDVWRADFDAHRAAHLEEAGDRGPGYGGEPVTVEIRRFSGPDGRAWYAALDVHQSAGAWRGSVAFHADGSGRVFRTGEVFREEDATAVKARFLEFDVSTLRAFLRSVLP